MPPLQVLILCVAAQDRLDNCLVEVRSAGHMGRGIFAAKDIPAGTRILSEIPLIMVPGNPWRGKLAGNIASFCEIARQTAPDIFALLDTLSSDESDELDPQTTEIVQNWFKDNYPKATDFVLDYYVPKYSRLFSIYQRYAVRLRQEDAGGVFDQYSLINHSCSPNAHAFYDHTKERHQVHLTRDVKADDQIFVSYNRFQALPRAERQAEHRLKGHNFVCDCSLCTSEEAEAIMQRVFVSYMSLSNFLVKEGVIPGDINSFFPTPTDNTEALAIAEELVGLFQHPSVGLEGADLKVTLHVCSLVNRRLGNVKAAAAYARQGLALQVRIWGFEAENFLFENDAAPWLHKIEQELSQMEAAGL